MNSLTIFAHYDGRWTFKNEYVDFKMVGLLVPYDCKLRILKQLVTDVLHICIPKNEIPMQYQVDQGLPPMKLDNDNAIKFYVEPKN